MSIKLKAEKREKKEKLSKDFIAVSLYGPSTEPSVLKVKSNDFLKVYSSAGESNLIELDFNGKKENVLVKEIQKDPVKNFVIHIDFYQVDMNKLINTEIPLEFTGESKAVKELGGMLIKNIYELSVECLPNDLVDHIDVDISVLQKIGDTIHVSDVKISDKIKILNNSTESIITVVEPKEEKVEETPVNEVVEGEKEEKDEKTEDKQEMRAEDKNKK